MENKTSSSSAIRAVLIRAWRERWSDVQWGINAKKIDSNIDPLNLTEAILEQAFIGAAPNILTLSYLKHSLSSLSLTYSDLFQVVSSKFEDGSVFLAKPNCSAAILDLIDVDRLNNVSEAALIKITLWLLKLIAASVKLTGDRVHGRNVEKAVKVLKFFTENDFFMALLCVAKIEERDVYKEISAVLKTLNEHVKSRPELLKITLALKNLDIQKWAAAASSSPLSAKANNKSDLSLTIQPLLAFEAQLRPTSDTTLISRQLCSAAILHGNLSFGEVVYQIIRASILSLDGQSDLRSLQWKALLVIKLPFILENLAVLMKVDTQLLKTPTETYKAFDKLLLHEDLLDDVNSRCRCDIVDVLLQVIKKTNLMTETEMDDVRKKIKKVENNEEDKGDKGDDLLRLIKAESMVRSILEALKADISNIESAEYLLKLLCDISGENLDLVLAASSASGTLHQFIDGISKLNDQSTESSGESGQKAGLRAALFDITFLMMSYIERGFEGLRIVDSEADNAAQVDPYVQQLLSGELKTQMVNWKKTCSAMPSVVKELIIARSVPVESPLSSDTLNKMVDTACAKLCAIPLCVLNWLKKERSAFYQMNFEEVLSAFEDKCYSDKSSIPQGKERILLFKSILDLDRKEEKMAKSDLSPRKRLQNAWREISENGGLTVDSVFELNNLHRIGGTDWFVESLVDQLFAVVHREDLHKMNHLLIAAFHLNLEKCTLSLLLSVMPKILLRPTLTDPHGQLLAKVVVGCVYSCLLPGNKNLKRSLNEEDATNSPAGKIRKMEDESALKVLPNAKSYASKEPKLTINEATAEFLHVLHKISLKTRLSPASKFAIHLLHETTRQVPKSLILQHLSLQQIQLLVKLSPEMFDMAILAQLFDSASFSGRRNMTKVMLLLRNSARKRKQTEELSA